MRQALLRGGAVTAERWAAVAGFYAEYTEKREPDLLISEVSLAPVAGGLRASCDLRHPTGKDVSWLSGAL